MGNRKKVAVLQAALVLLLLVLVPAAAVCNMSNDDFMACQPAAAATEDPASTAPDPSAECCHTLGKADLKCLCSYKNSPWLNLYNIDPKRAMELPAKCGLATPPDC